MYKIQIKHKSQNTKIQKFVIWFLCFVFLGFGSSAFADTAEPQGFTYLFHLYYDNGQLFADRDLPFKYDVIPETFVPEIINTQFPYKGEIINLKGEVAQTFQFDPRQGGSNFLKGKISVKAPYLPDGQKVVFYDSQGRSLLTIFISESSFCNDDGACNSDVGEDNTTCPLDCKALPVTPKPSNSPVVTGSEKSGLTSAIIYVLIGMGLIGGFWYWRRRKGPKF